jgi:bifunctional non-homologous end joining protein LigD
MTVKKNTASFMEPMLCLATDSLPGSDEWQFELDGYRALAIRSGGRVRLRSRNDKDFAGKYPLIARAFAGLPDETVVDGEIVALDENGRPSFNLLQNAGTSTQPIFFYAFDVPILAGRGLTCEPLEARRTLLRTEVLSRLTDPIRYSPVLDASLPDLIHSIRVQGLEGLVAKRRDSRYEAGQRSGAWLKMRVNRGQEFVIGGYTPGPKNFDALIFGYYEGDNLIYVARTRNGFTPATREKLFQRLRALETTQCPFANLPETKSGRWGFGLTAAKMSECRWLKPKLVGQFEFTEWTPDNHLRHARFVGLRVDKNARDVHRET